MGAARAQRPTGRDPAAEPMAGAGGGLAGGLWAFAGAALRPGAALVLDTIGFDAAMRGLVRGRDRRGLAWTARPCAARPCSRSRPAAARAECRATRCRAWTALDVFEHRLMNIEVEPAARNGALASEADVERAARRLARRLLAVGRA